MCYIFSFRRWKQVAMELNETPEQPRTKRKESPKQIQALKAVLHT
ncbi:hypothetical protein [Bacillus thuringiensis]|nr:hypothetical protein [Bacillus thuringiensis]